MSLIAIPPAARLIGMLGLAAALIVGALDWRSAREARGELKICTAAAGDVKKPLEGCAKKVAAQISAARQAAACEAALKAGDAFATSTSCSSQVRDRVARLQTAEHNLADVRAQLAQAEQRSIAAVARAEQRATQTAERKARAKAAISAAPRDAGGLLTCDADCLRNLSGGPARAER